MEQRYLSAKEAGVYTGLGLRYMRRLVANKRITYYKVGRQVRFARVDLDELMAKGRVGPGRPRKDGGDGGEER